MLVLRHFKCSASWNILSCVVLGIGLSLEWVDYSRGIIQGQVRNLGQLQEADYLVPKVAEARLKYYNGWVEFPSRSAAFCSLAAESLEAAVWKRLLSFCCLLPCSISLPMSWIRGPGRWMGFLLNQGACCLGMWFQSIPCQWPWPWLWLRTYFPRRLRLPFFIGFRHQVRMPFLEAQRWGTQGGLQVGPAPPSSSAELA